MLRSARAGQTQVTAPDNPGPSRQLARKVRIGKISI